MKISAEQLELVSAAFEYPAGNCAGIAVRARAASVGLTDTHPEMAESLAALAAYLESAAPGEAEERYTSLFDLSPVCTLHLGFHLFGDAYQRGALLAGLATEQRQVGIEACHDLPDFLPTVLRLLGRLADPDSQRILADSLILPALFRMNKALEASSAPWSPVLRALPSVVLPFGSGTPEPDGSFPAKSESESESEEVAFNA